MGSTLSILKDTRDPTRLLLALPNELLLLVAQNFECPSDIYSLLLTNRRLFILMIPLLHEFAVRDRGCMTALQWAAAEGHIGLVKLLLEKGFDINYSPMKGNIRQWPWTPLYYGIKSGSLEVVKLLLENGAAIEVQNEFGNTALHHVVHTTIWMEKKLGYSLSGEPYEKRMEFFRRARQMPAVMRLLLDKKTKLSLRNDRGNTALHEAALMCDEKTTAMKLLLEYGAPVNTRNYHGKSALHCAANLGNEASVRLLIQHGANVSAKDKRGVTPLHMAASRGHVGVVRVLVEHGADVTAKDKAGLTLDDYARRAPSEEQKARRIAEAKRMEGIDWSLL